MVTRATTGKINIWNVSGLPELGGCPLPPGSVLVTSGQVTVPAGEEHTILCPAGTVRVNDSDAYFSNFTNGSIVIDGSDWPDEPTGLKVINQNVSASITGVPSMACVPVPE